MSIPRSMKERVLEEFEEKWLESDPDLVKSDLLIAQKLVLNPKLSPARWECDLFSRIRKALSPEEQRDFSKTVREYWVEKHKKQKSISDAKRRAEIENLKKIEYRKNKHAFTETLYRHFEINFKSAFEFYMKNGTAYLSNDEYEKLKVKFLKSWAKKHLEREINELDSEQSNAIGSPDVDIQVIARAGSGKTTIIVSRAYFLQKHCGVGAKEMLLLAFNRDAADEMRKRLSSYLPSHTPHVMTFHALAYAVVKPEQILFDEPGGGQRQSAVLQSIIDEYLRNPRFYQQIRQLMTAHFRKDWDRIVSGGYDRLPGEMLRYRRSLTRESLDGRPLKSFGEKVIADFLFEHDIKYYYEKSFWWNGVRYRPDFTVFTENRNTIVIEYFGLEGDPEYDAQSDLKRSYWRANPGYTLVEMNHGDLVTNRVDGFRALLKKKLESNGVPCVRLSEEQIWDLIKERAIDRFTTVVTGFIRRCRKQSLTPDELSSKIQKHASIDDIEKRFLELASEFYASYLDRFEVANSRITGEEDFDGLIQQAAEYISSGKTTFIRKSESGNLAQLRYVFIDEYQDFTPLFNRLMQGIRNLNPNVVFFCVGDDWQAINGFAGSELRYFRNFAKSFPNSQKLQVSTNYRSCRSIVGFSNSLMADLGSPAKPHCASVGKVLVVNVSQFNPTPIEKKKHGQDDITSAVQRIIYRDLKLGYDIVLLSRKNTLPWYIDYKEQQHRDSNFGIDLFLSHIRSKLPSELADKVTVSTVHKYKGRQKDVVIVLDVVSRCFPLIHPDWVFNRILGENIECIIEEERRLLYVALTRAKQHLYLVTDWEQRSPFLDDLKDRVILKDVNWSEYPPVDYGQWHVTMRIGNQKHRGTSPSFAIRDLLKKEDFRWDPDNKVWYVAIPIEESVSRTIETQINQSKWSEMGDGLVVRFFNESEDEIAAYTIDSGKWSLKTVD